MIAEQAGRIAELQRRLGQASPSSRPPSSDAPWDQQPAKKRSSRSRSGRKPGKQPGSASASRSVVDDLDETFELVPDHCARCEQSLHDTEETARVRRQVARWQAPPPPTGLSGNLSSSRRADFGGGRDGAWCARGQPGRGVFGCMDRCGNHNQCFSRRRGCLVRGRRRFLWRPRKLARTCLARVTTARPRTASGIGPRGQTSLVHPQSATSALPQAHGALEPTKVDSAAKRRYQRTGTVAISGRIGIRRSPPRAEVLEWWLSNYRACPQALRNSAVVAEQCGAWQIFGGWTIYDNRWVRLGLVAVEAPTGSGGITASRILRGSRSRGFAVAS